MAHDYTPKFFLRQTPNILLKDYFDSRGVLTKIDWKSLKEAESEVVYDAWQALDKQTREEIEAEFRAIHDLANVDGVRVIIEEGHFHERDLAPELDKYEGFHAKVMWVFLHHKRIFTVAELMDHADHMDRRYRRKRKDMPRKDPDVSVTARKELSRSLIAYYREKEGRGDICNIDVFLRGGRYHYFFAYPADYAGTFIGYSANGEFVRRPQQPVFDLIFTYDPIDGTLDLFAHGDKRLKQDLQKIFARTILHEEIGPETKNSQPYDLSNLKRRDFSFNLRPEDGLATLRVKNLRLAVMGNTRRRITVEGDIRNNQTDVYDFMDKVLNTQQLPLAILDVDHATIRAEFAAINGRTKRRTFGISRDSCNLKENPEDIKIMECLKRSEVARV